MSLYHARAGNSCHLCHTGFLESELFFCSAHNKNGRTCRKKICDRCLSRKFPDLYKPEERVQGKWHCPSCLHRCPCASCRLCEHGSIRKRCPEERCTHYKDAFGPVCKSDQQDQQVGMCTQPLPYAVYVHQTGIHLPCHSCGQFNAAGAKFCPQCGKEQQHSNISLKGLPGEVQLNQNIPPSQPEAFSPTPGAPPGQKTAQPFVPQAQASNETSAAPPLVASASNQTSALPHFVQVVDNVNPNTVSNTASSTASPTASTTADPNKMHVDTVTPFGPAQPNGQLPAELKPTVPTVPTIPSVSAVPSAPGVLSIPTVPTAQPVYYPYGLPPQQPAAMPYPAQYPAATHRAIFAPLHPNSGPAGPPYMQQQMPSMYYPWIAPAGPMHQLQQPTQPMPHMPYGQVARVPHAVLHKNGNTVVYPVPLRLSAAQGLDISSSLNSALRKKRQIYVFSRGSSDITPTLSWPLEKTLKSCFSAQRDFHIPRVLR
eukprot:g9143.t1